MPLIPLIVEDRLYPLLPKPSRSPCTPLLPPSRKPGAGLMRAGAQEVPQYSLRVCPFGLSPTPPRRFAPGRQGRRPEGPQKFSPSLLQVRAARSGGGPQAQRASPAIPCGIAFVPTSSQSGASGGGNELRRVAALRLPGRRTARPCGSQQFSPKHRPVSASLRLRSRSAVSFSARLGDSFCFGSSPKQLNRLLRRGARYLRAL